MYCFVYLCCVYVENFLKFNCLIYKYKRCKKILVVCIGKIVDINFFRDCVIIS